MIFADILLCYLLQEKVPFPVIAPILENGSGLFCSS